MSKYTLIAAALRTINDAKFQLVCNEYLQRFYRQDVISPGTVVGKEKTRKGKPDAYIRFPDGTFLLAEYTTKDKKDSPKDFFSKLYADLQDCTNVEKLGLKADEVRQIVLCCNDTITIEEGKKLHEYAKPFDLKIVTVEGLSTFLQDKGKAIAKGMLNIPYETNQLLTKEEFLNFYHKQNLSTSLRTTLVGRESEKEELLEAIEKYPMTIVTGAPGVGKSRLVIAAMDTFLERHPEYNVTYVLSQNDSITDDLISYLADDDSHLLFIDDANRQLDNFIKILYQQQDTENAIRIKIVLTVRDYAYEEIRRECKNSEFKVLTFSPMTDELIRELLTVNNYQVEDQQLFNRIVSISKGNPRLAVMAAIFVKERPDVNLLLDVSTVYEAYYETIIQDKDAFKDPIILKTLGLLSFFYAVDMESLEARNIFHDFDLDHEQFLSAVNILEDLELVDIYKSFTVKIVEQVLGTYFFYKVFLKDRILSFSKLINNYSKSYPRRMNDSFIPAVGAFGTQNAFEPVKNDLLNYYATVASNPELKYSFLHVLGQYFPLQTFSAVEEIINNGITVSSDPFKKNPVTLIYLDRILSLLGKFYGSNDSFELKTSIKLTVDYIRKDQSLQENSLKSFVEKIQITENDFPSLTKQFTVFNLLSEPGDPLKNKFLLLALSKVLLTSHFPNEAYHKVNDKWELRPVLQELRGGFWQYLNKYYQNEREKIYLILLDFLSNITYGNTVLINFDAAFVNCFILNNLVPEKFEDVIFVNSYLDFVNKKDVTPDWQEIVRERFQSEIFTVFQQLKFEHRTRLSPNSSEREYEIGQARKGKELVSKIGVKDLAGFQKIFPQLRDLYTFPYFQQCNFNLETELWLVGIMKHHPKEAFEILHFYLKQGNIAKINPYPVYQEILSWGKGSFERLYAIINNTTFQNQEGWKDAYFFLLPEDDYSKEKLEEAVQFYQTIKGPVYWPEPMVNKFEIIFPGTFIRILTMFTDRRKEESTFQYKLRSSFFSRHPELLESDFDLAKTAYFDAIAIDPHYDIGKSEFMIFFNRQSSFLSEYLNHQFPRRNHTSESPLIGIGKIWECGEAESAIYEALLIMAKSNLCAVLNHPESMFFRNLSDDQTLRAVSLLRKMLADYSEDEDIVNMILDISRNALPDHYHALIIHQMEHNPSIEFFKKLELYNNHFSSNGRSSWEELKAKILTEISETVKAHPQSYKYLQHLNVLEQRIVQYRKMGEEDRKKWFMGFD